MRIGWTQKISGSGFGSGITPACSAEAPVSRENALVSGKLLGVVMAAVALGLVFACHPYRLLALTRLDVLLLGLVLMGQGLAYAALFVPRLSGVAPLVGLVPLAGLLLPQLGPAALVALGVLMVLEAGVSLAIQHHQRRVALPLAALMLPALVALVVAVPRLGVVLAAAVLVVPPLALVLRARRAPATPVSEAHPDAAPALLAAALAAEGRLALVTDAMGKIDRQLSPASAEGMERFPEDSLVEATLIADRVMLLSALAQAARQPVASQPFTLRLREGRLGAGYPVPPRFAEALVRVMPLVQVPGRAMVLIEFPAAPEGANAPVAVSRPSGNGTLLAKALHDGLAPFNAGLGFLEMVADPRLAPRDFTALHDFTAEAHKAISEAHRNTVLLGQWMRLNQDESHARASGEASARRLLTEAIRLLNIEDSEKRGDLVVDSSVDAATAFGAPLNLVRFALAVLLRFGLSASHVDLSMREEGDDLVFVLLRREGNDLAAGDAFQQGLEQAAASTGSLRFEAAGPLERRLRLTGVARSRRTADAIRLAS